RSDGKTGKEVSTDELNASMPIRAVHAAEYGCPQLTPCGRHRLERVVGIDWNAWSPSVGTRGRFQWNTQAGGRSSPFLSVKGPALMHWLTGPLAETSADR